MVGLITDNDETVYREVVRKLAVWCQDNNLYLNVSKTKELIVNYRKMQAEQASINIDRAFHFSLHGKNVLLLELHCWLRACK